MDNQVGLEKKITEKTNAKLHAQVGFQMRSARYDGRVLKAS